VPGLRLPVAALLAVRRSRGTRRLRDRRLGLHRTLHRDADARAI
jgi:hypothetical protein